MTDEEFRQEMADMLGEVEKAFASDTLKAFSIVMVNPDGSFRHLSAYCEGFGMKLLPAVDIAHASIRADRMGRVEASRQGDS